MGRLQFRLITSFPAEPNDVPAVDMHKFIKISSFLACNRHPAEFKYVGRWPMV